MKHTIPPLPDILDGPPSDDQFLRSMHLHQESDRGFALIAAAWIDDSLQGVIRSRFIDDQVTADELLVGDSPLVTFSAKTKLLYCMGVITKVEKQNLDIIRSIRNLFAHQRGNVSFRTAKIRDKSLSLSLVEDLKDFTHLDKSQPRTYFSAVAMHFIQYFVRMAKPKKRPSPGKGIKQYFAKLRDRMRRRAEEARAQQEADEW
jgi:DNA-binding MltR family transcriptional regulator